MDVNFSGHFPTVQKVATATSLALAWVRLVTAALILQRNSENRMATIEARKRDIIAVSVGRNFSSGSVHDQTIGDLHVSPNV